MGLFDGCWNKFVPNGRLDDVFIIVLGVFTHVYDIINKSF